MASRLFVLMIMALVGNSLCAQSDMAKLWIAMPDSVVGYLNKSKRTEMVDFYNMGVKAETANLLYGVSTLDSISTNYADIRLSQGARMQLQILERFSGDSVICMAKTLYGEEPETELRFFSTAWEPLPDDWFIDAVLQDELIGRPDTITQENFNQLVALVDPVMVKADIIPQDFAIQFSLSTPLIRKEDRERLKPILKSKKVKWDGERFK